MKSYIIISGGRVDLYSLQEIMDRHLESSRVIAVDKGIETCNKIGIVPDVIVGDFDSASKVTVGVYRKMAKKMHSIQFVDLDTHKDFTDTHVASCMPWRKVLRIFIYRGPQEQDLITQWQT